MASQTATLQSNRPFAARPVTSSATPAAPKPSERVRAYKDFLTPALHRRFTRSALLVFAACYLVSLLIGSSSLLWFWNPISLTGIRSVLLLGSCLAIFIVRVANLHVGSRPSASSADAVVGALRSFRTAHTLAWHVWSAWFFGELYIWSRGADSHLAWVDPGQVNEWPRLNENPIFLRSFLCCLGIAQTGLHLMRGYDRIPMTEEQLRNTSKDDTSKLPSSVQELLTQLPFVGGRAFKLALPGFVFTIPVYFLFIRHLAWPYCYAIGRTLHSDLPASSRPTGIGVDHVFQLAWQCISSAVMLVFLWELSNAVFTIYVSQPPLKKEQPLTSEIKDLQGNVVSKSKDPNASLLNGLKSKKEVPKSFAFWELWLISSRFDSRRKTIYTEVDRTDGSTWQQISKLCLDEIEATKDRIQQARQPADAKKDAEAKEHQQSQSPEPFAIPKIADRQVLDGDVWQRGKSTDLAQSVGNMAKSIGQTPNAGNPLSPHARRALEWGRDRLISKDDQDRLSRKALKNDAGGMALRILSNPLGEVFRQTFARAVGRAVLGSPNSCKSTIIFAATSLARLTVSSLREDDYGQVAKSVPAIVRAFTSTINEINAFTSTLTPHWTDVTFTDRDRDNVADVAEVLDALRGGLQDVILAFSEYASSVGLTKLDLREAKEAIGHRPDVRRVA